MTSRNGHTVLVLVIAATLCLTGPSLASPPPNLSDIIDTTKAKALFEMAQTISEQDGGRLWGKKLYGPMLFVDPQTRIAVANQSDRDGQLYRVGSMYAGVLDESVNLANTAAPWGGITWTMILWPRMTASEYDRAALMMHESWHRIQYELGFPMVTSRCSHLDRLNGRFLLKMEWRALASALTSQGAARDKALKDALIFREYRRSLFTHARQHENEYEMHEGLAEYTGLKLSGLTENQLRQIMAKRLKEAENSDSFIMSFAYQSGPAYGLLLDDLKIDWREGLRPVDDIGKILREFLSFRYPDNIADAAANRYDAYDGNLLLAAEKEYDKTQKELHRKYTGIFVDGPVLVLPNANMNIGHNPGEALFSLDDYGVVHQTMTVTADWGKLTVTNGALRDKNWMFVKVPAPKESAGNPITTNGWTLQLNDGWKILPTAQTGNYLIVKE